MASKGDNAPVVIIKKIKKGGHGGHHGGAWKVAYADFVTAMMAFFLLLWLLNATTDEQKRGIADYFTQMSVTRSYSGGGGVLSGRTVTDDGVMPNDHAAVGMTIALPSDAQIPENKEEEFGESASTDMMDQEQLDELLAKREEEQFKAAEDALRQAIESVPELQELAESLIIDETPEGLRIQIVDQDKYSMFPLGSAVMHERTKKLMAMVANAIAGMPQKIAIKGHTDATPYSTDKGYSNWELSTDRANASRRALIEAGLQAARIESVVGRAEQDPLIADDPLSPRNRRISIILLRERPVRGAATSDEAATPADETAIPADEAATPADETATPADEAATPPG